MVKEKQFFQILGAEVKLASGPVSMGRKILAPTGVQTPDRTARSE